MAKLSQLLTIEDLLESYDGLTTLDPFVTDCFRSCVETTVDHVLAKLNRLLVSKTKLSCRNVLTANFETMSSGSINSAGLIGAMIAQKDSFVDGT